MEKPTCCLDQQGGYNNEWKLSKNHKIGGLQKIQMTPLRFFEIIIISTLFYS
jgi:hypothetical protein